MNVPICLPQWSHLVGIGLFILLIQFDFESLSPNFIAVHLLDSCLGWLRVVKADEAYSFRLAVFLGHDSGRKDSSKGLKQIIKLWIFHIIRKMKQKQIWPWRAQFSGWGFHIIQFVSVLLNIPVLVRVWCVNLSTWWWSLILRFSSSIVVVIFLTLSRPNLVIYIDNRVGKRVKVLFRMLFAHIWIVLLFLESDFDWNSTSMEIGLAI